MSCVDYTIIIFFMIVNAQGNLFSAAKFKEWFNTDSSLIQVYGLQKDRKHVKLCSGNHLLTLDTEKQKCIETTKNQKAVL